MSQTFIRDRFTWLGYTMLAYYAYMQSVVSPLTFYIQDELHLDYTQRGYHLSAFALGMIVAGLSGAWAAQRFGRNIVFWGGGVGLVLGGLLLTVGRVLLVTVAGALVMGVIGSFLLIMVQALLSEYHGKHRAFALTEANVLASITSGLAPLMVGVGQSSGLGWRAAIYLSVGVLLVLGFVGRRVPLPAAPVAAADDNQPRLKLPVAFWAYCVVDFLAVSVEWCFIFWASEFLEKNAGLSKDAATISMTLFFAAFVLGRALGSRLTRTLDTGRLLLVAGLIVLIGFPIFWLGRTPILNIAGLFICGLGIANLFPLTLSAASGAAAGQENKGSARISLFSGLAIFAMPQLVGILADLFSIQTAYGIVLPLALALIIATFYANRLSRLSQSQAV